MKNIMVMIILVLTSGVALSAEKQDREVLTGLIANGSPMGAMVGAGWYQYKKDGLGLYANGLMGLETVWKHNPDKGSANKTWILNAGVTSYLHSNIGVYAGVGWAVEKLDEVVVDWLSDRRAVGTLNGNIGLHILVPEHNVTYEIGYDSYNRNVYGGVGYVW